MAIKTLTTMQTDTQMKLRDTAALTTAQLTTLINECLRLIWESKQDWTVRLNPTQVGLNALTASFATTSGTYGARIESVHGVYIEGSATGVASLGQLEKLELGEFIAYSTLGSGLAGTSDTAGTPEFYACEPLAADTDTTAANHGLWKFYFLATNTTARHYSVKARLRYTDLSGANDVPDCPDSWCDVATTLAAIRGAYLLGRSQLGQELVSLLPDWAEQFGRRVAENIEPRPKPGEMVPR